MKIVFASLPAYGHLYPMLPLAQACAKAGHDVVVATDDPFLGALPVPTARGVAEGLSLRDIEQETLRNHPDLEPGPQFAVFMFGETTVKYVAPVLTELFGSFEPDLVIHEVTDIGAAVAATAHGVRAIAFGLGLWNPPVAAFYEVAGADPTLPGGYLDPMPTSVQHLAPVPASRIPIRSVAWAPPAPLPEWLRGNSRQTVYITLGTVAFGAVEVLSRAVRETAAHDVDVLVAVGPSGDPSLLGELPPNVHVEKFVPQAEVLSHVDLVVHHGGAGTMLGALAAGLPQLILPQGADQPFNGEAMVRAGAGRSLPNDAQTPGAIEQAVGALLTEGPEHLAAKRIAEEIAAMPSPDDVASLLQ